MQDTIRPIDSTAYAQDGEPKDSVDQDTYYNDVRAHSSLDMKTHTAMAFGEDPDEEVVSIDHYRWKKHCNGVYELPVAA